MLDIATLRVVFSIITACMLVLFYVTTYRVTRSPFCGWWCLALVLFSASGAAWLLNGTAAQVVANPAGNVLGVCGASAVWLAARSLERPHPPWWALAIVPVATAVASAVDHPGTNNWSGGLVFLAAMTFNLALAARELRRTWRGALGRRSAYSPVTTSLALVSTVIAAFYLVRTIIFAAVGPDHPLFANVVGTTPTTLLTTVMLVAVSHSMGALSQEQLMQDLRHRVEVDDLTGLLNRKAFWQLAEETMRGIPTSAVIMADLDNFKQINDVFGHGIGDQVITTFAQAVRENTRSTDLAARFGGEEFVILLPGASKAAAVSLTRAVSQILRESHAVPGPDPATASYGIAAVDARTSLDDAINQADDALYQAKDAGRDQTITFSEPGRTSPARRRPREAT